jgi:hypothetical protein
VKNANSTDDATFWLGDFSDPVTHGLHAAVDHLDWWVGVTDISLAYLFDLDSGPLEQIRRPERAELDLRHDTMPSPPLSIVQSLSPRVAVLSSDGVIQACEANGCRGMEELLRPWEGSTDRGAWLFCDTDVRLLIRSVNTVINVDTDNTPHIPPPLCAVRPGIPQSRGCSTGSGDGRRHDQQLCR